MTSNETPQSAPGYRGWMAVVILLGVLIILGLGVIAGTFLGGPRPREPGAAFSTDLDAPGAHIESADLQGNRILLKLSGALSGDELVVLDAGTGRVVGRVGVHGKP